MKRTLLLAICTSILTVLATQLAFGHIALGRSLSAQIPEIISYQGTLYDNNGTPLNGNYDLTVRIYNQESGGSALWEETHADVLVNNGLFNVMLGTINPLTVAFDEPYYMGLSINSEDELTPRLTFASVATAFVAKVAYTLAPDADGNITLGGNVDVEGKIRATEYCDEYEFHCVRDLLSLSSSIKVASGQDVRNGTVIDLSDYGFDPYGSDPHIIISERSSSYSYNSHETKEFNCYPEKKSKLEFKGTCQIFFKYSVLGATFNWLAIQIN